MCRGQSGIRVGDCPAVKAAYFGWLEYVLVTPRYHHWHHARQADYADANYAIHLPLVDMLMGTFRRPPARTWPEEYGVLELETVPVGIIAQLLMPFRRQRRFDDYVGRENATDNAPPQS